MTRKARCRSQPPRLENRETRGTRRFDSHEKVFENRRPNQDQDLVWKFDIPSDERDKVLGILSAYNLNAFSLFGSEESLLETMWYREYPRQTKPVIVKAPFVE